MDIETKTKLIEKAVMFYERCFSQCKDVKTLFDAEGITDRRLYERHRMGFSDGSLVKALPDRGKIIDDLKELGILLQNGSELFKGCITFPIMDEDGKPVNVCGYNPQTGKYLHLPDNLETAWNLEAKKLYDEMVEAETIMDALRLEMKGIKNVMVGQAKGKVPVARKTSEGTVIERGLRKYTVIGLERGENKLKATVKVEKAGRFHVDTINFYSAKERKNLCQEICRTFEEAPEAIEADLNGIISLAESNAVDDGKSPKNSVKAYEMTPQEEGEALAYGKSADLIGNILKDFEACGYVGEQENNNKILCYLAGTSRKMAEKSVISVIVLSSSGAGKSALQDTALSLMPPEDVVKLTNLSGKALFYKEKDSLKHRILALEESSATNEEANYAIRSLISSGQLTSEVTVRDNSTGKMTTQVNVIDAGCTSVFFTTTDPEQDAETASRFFIIGINESDEQTKAILEHQMRRHSMEGLETDERMEQVQNRNRNFQRLLKPYRVVNSFRMKFNDTRLQARRLYPQILNLINAVCFLRQMQKDVKTHNGIEFIEVDMDDIGIALKLAKDILGKTINELSMPSQDLLKLLDAFIEGKKGQLRKENNDMPVSKSNISFTRKEVRNKIQWSNTRLHLYLKELLEHEFVIQESAKRNTLQHYRLLYDSNGKFTWLNNIEKMIGVEEKVFRGVQADSTGFPECSDGKTEAKGLNVKE